MESSIAEFRSRKYACELLPTMSQRMSVHLVGTALSEEKTKRVTAPANWWVDEMSNLHHYKPYPCGRGNSATSDA